MSTVHLPAWQSLGLKLKNQFPQTPTEEIRPQKKRKFSQEEVTKTDRPNGVKRRQQNITSLSPSTPSHGARGSSTGSESLPSSDSRRKSVTFTADTKVEDGCSSKRLVQAAYASRMAQMEQGASNATTGKLPNGQSLKAKSSSSMDTLSEAQIGNGIAHAKQDAQGAITTKDIQHSTANPSSKPTTPAVAAAREKKKCELATTYLNQYAHARSTWKFNKRRQNVLLHMVLDTESIPTEHDTAVKSYLEGLQGTASRQRLGKMAREIVAETSDNAPDSSRIARAKLVLEALALGEEEDATMSATSETDPSVTQTATTQAANDNTNTTAPTDTATAAATTKKRKRRRVRKRRNVTTSDSDSSSSSSSDEDSESDSGD